MGEEDAQSQDGTNDQSKTENRNNDESEKILDTIDAKMPHTLHLLYSASKLRIFKLADKIEANELVHDITLRQDESKVDIPIADTWQFKVGDWVRIKYPVTQFKEIQSRTLGWNVKLYSIHDCVAVVADRLSVYENGVTIYAPSRFSTSRVYAGLLELVSEDERKDDVPFTSRWKVNDYVTTIMDEKVVELMQRGLDTIPDRYLGRKGRIIAVTRAAVIVTFNERTSLDINPYLLVRSPDQTPLQVPERKHDKFSLGEKVRVISNIKQLVKNQNGHGGWSDDMTKLAGKEVRIIHIRKSQDLYVQRKLGRRWAISKESVYSLEEPVKEIPQDDCEFSAGNIVKIKLTNNMRQLLQAKNVPMIFLDYLRSTAQVKLIDDDFDYLIKFNCDQNVSVFAPTIRMATKEEREHHLQVKDDVKRIKIGSKVVLDVGPPNFVKAVLKNSNASADVVFAMTHPSTVVGFADDNRAVIKYECGRRYKLKKKFLTVPEKFNMQGKTDGMNFDTAKEIQEAVASCVQMLRDGEDLEENDENPVRILTMSFDSTPTMDLRVYSIDATVAKISELLLTMYGWSVQTSVAEESVVWVSKLSSFDREIKITLFFNQDPYITEIYMAKPQSSVDSKQKICSQNDQMKEERASTSTENVNVPPAAAPMSNNAAPQYRNEDHQTHVRIRRSPSEIEGYIPLPSLRDDEQLYLAYYVDAKSRTSIQQRVSTEPNREFRTRDIINIHGLGNFYNVNN